MADFDVQQVREAVESRTRQMGYLMSHRETDAALAVIVPAVTQQIRALHVRHSDTCECFIRDAEGLCFIAGTCDGCSGMPEYPCPTVRVLDEIESAVKAGER